MMTKYEIKELNVSDIKPDKNQPRKTFEDEPLQHLAESILSNGLLNPIEVDEDYIITDGERRWRAHKLAKIKTITARIVKTEDKTEKLRRQLIFTLQDEEIDNEEKYPKIVELWKSENANIAPTSKESEEWCKGMGISLRQLRSAFDFCKIREEEPELTKDISPSIIQETANLPKEERRKILEEFKGTKDKEKSGILIKELVKDKREKIKLQKTLEEIKNTKDFSIKVTKTEERLEELSEKISQQIHSVGKVISYFRFMRKTKLYVSTAKDKEKFFKSVDSQIDKLEKYVSDLRNLKENLELEVIKE